MKKLVFSLAVLGFACTAAFGQTNANSVPENLDELEEWQQEFFNLPEDRRNQFVGHIEKARQMFQQKRVFETIEELEAARKIFGNSPDLQNLLGACQVEFRAFNKAMEHFRKADAMSPNNPSIVFNIAEIDFVQKNWADAARSFNRVIELTEDDQSQIQLSRLSEFKLMLCQLKTGDIDEARKLVDKYDPLLEDTPLPYYAKAAIAYHEERDIDAEQELARARRVFQNPAMLSAWQDTLMEFGYIKSFYGGDLAEDE